jgi:hypothetical protein
MPIHPYSTLPLLMKSAIAFLMLLIGMAKPRPMLPPVEEAIQVFMPMTSPWMFTRAPPELPLLIEASVWMKSLIFPSGPPERLTALTMPAVTEDTRPRGLPIAMAQSPTRTVEESPRAWRRRCLGVGLEFNEGDVLAIVLADEGSLIFLLVVRDDGDLAGRARDMVVREHVDGLAVLLDDDAGAQALLGIGLRGCPEPSSGGVLKKKRQGSWSCGLDLGVCTFSTMLISTIEGWTLSAT